MAEKVNGGDDEERQLEKELKKLSEERKAVFEKTKEPDEQLRKIREEENIVQMRLQQIRSADIEKDQRERERERYEARLNVESKDMKQKFETLRTALRKMKDAMQTQQKEKEQALRKMKDAMQTEQKEKEQALRQVASLEDEIAALRQISAETQQRQLNEQSRFFSTKQQHQKQQRKGKHVVKISCCMKYVLIAEIRTSL